MFLYLLTILLTILFSLIMVSLGWYLIWKFYLIKRKLVIALLDIKNGKINL